MVDLPAGARVQVRQPGLVKTILVLPDPGGGGGGSEAPASETVAGIAELATQAETNTGTDDARIVTPLKLQTRLAAYAQPLDSDLTAIAALTTTSYGRAILELANQAALMGLLSAASETASGVAEIATQGETNTGTDDVRFVTPLKLQTRLAAFAQPLDSDLTAIAALATTSYGRALLTLADQAALVAAVGSSSTTASGVVELATSAETITGTDTARAVTPAGAAAAYQPLDSDLTAFAAKTAPTGDVVGTTDSQTLTNKTLTAPAISSPTGLVKGDVGLGNVANVDQQNAANITSGTVDPARLGSGASITTKFLRGDSTWQTISAGGGQVNSVVAGANIDVDATDPANPIVSVETLTLADVSDVTASAAEVNVLDGVTSSTAELNILDGVTATAAELNALDGITATVTELNFTDGVTSAIQTQINNTNSAVSDVEDNLDLKATIASPTFTGTPVLPNAIIDEEVVAASGTTGTVTLDLATSRIFTLSPTGNVTTLTLSNVPASGRAVTVTLLVTQGGTPRTIATPTGGIFMGAATPTQVASKACAFTYVTVDGGTVWYCSAAVQV